MKFLGGLFRRVNLNLAIRILDDTTGVVQKFDICCGLLLVSPAHNLAVAAGHVGSLIVDDVDEATGDGRSFRIGHGCVYGYLDQFLLFPW